MRAPGRRAWLQAGLLALPLAGFAFWLVTGVIRATHAPALPSPPSSSGPHLPSTLGPPGEDYPEDRLEERVNGAADYLRGHGCRRLAVWRLEEPRADLELLLFRDAAGAGAVFARDAGPARTPGPGDEAVVSDRAILFRRGPAYARLLADPSLPPPEAAALEAAALRFDDALASAAERRP